MTVAEKLTLIAENEQKVYDEGKNTGVASVWNSIQGNGKRAGYSMAFVGTSWSKATFKPTFDIVPTGDAGGMFRNATSEDEQFSMEEIESENSVKFDFSKVTGFGFCFACGLFKTLSTIDLSSATYTDYGFYDGYNADCKKQRIEHLICSDATVFGNSTFGYCSELEYVGFEGVMAKNGLNLQWSTKLSHESLLSLIDILEDKSSDTSSTVWKVTIGSTNKAKLSEEELLTVQNKGWYIE